MPGLDPQASGTDVRSGLMTTQSRLTQLLCVDLLQPSTVMRPDALNGGSRYGYPALWEFSCSKTICASTDRVMSAPVFAS